MVVLPAPDGPTSATSSPGSASKSIVLEGEPERPRRRLVDRRAGPDRLQRQASSGPLVGGLDGQAGCIGGVAGLADGDPGRRDLVAPLGVLERADRFVAGPPVADPASASTSAAAFASVPSVASSSAAASSPPRG